MTRILVVDRIVEGVAVLLPDDGGAAVEVPAAWLPGVAEGDCVGMEGAGAAFHPLPEETLRRRRRIRAKLDRLRRG